MLRYGSTCATMGQLAPHLGEDAHEEQPAARGVAVQVDI
jgi:hypothetical protein